MEFKINNITYNIKENYTIFQFCSLVGLNVPCFCYHEKLAIAGNCRMCLVETNVNSKLELACTTSLCSNMNIFINSDRVKKARESVMEFLLVIIL
jgi:NADH dehydrogenase/NADH:ubiquinone oxidoreductase subunit G